MAGLRNLMILGVMLIGVVVGVEGVTDQQFKELSNMVRRLQDENQRQFSKLENKIAEQDLLIERLLVDRGDETIPKETAESLDAELAQNTTIEERVALLEIQVVEIEEDITLLVENDNFLFDEQVIQDERLFQLETETEEIEEEVESLQDTTQQLDSRVTVLEENGGSDGNSSISELEERVETLEGTASDHETRLTAVEAGVEDLEGTTEDLESRLTSAEENIQGLQTTDTILDARVSALEENGNGTIAFHSVLTSYSTISEGTAVKFNQIVLNEGNGYDSTTGIFTVPLGGDGLYYFSTHLSVTLGEFGRFSIQLNNVTMCSGYGDENTNEGSDSPQATCSALLDVSEGDEVKLVYILGTSNEPLLTIWGYRFNGFNGFRI